MNTTKICNSCGNEFAITEGDLVFYKKIEVPEPNACPDCRLMRRLLERNAKHLYYRTCKSTDKKTFSQYHQDQPFPVYCPATWWGDSWDGLTYGQDFDFSRNFFDQFYELKCKIPHCALFNTESTNTNSAYTNCTAYIKNCYLVAETDHCEDCYYGNLLKKCKSLTDCTICYESELCYECIDSTGCYDLHHSQDCQNCKESSFLKNCIGCESCIGCINQRHKKYMIFNEQYSKEEFKEMKEMLELHSNTGITALKERCRIFFEGQPNKCLIAEQNTNSIGDHLYNSKNSYFCFDSKDLEDCKYCAKLSLGVKSSMDYNSWGSSSELLYQCSGCGDNCYKLKFCAMCQTNVRECEYSYELFSCSNCFGCVGLKKKEYCILNKQFSREEYYALKGKIIEHMKRTGEYGEFFPIKMGAFSYNESIAIDAFPLTKEQALARGYKWRDDDSSQHFKQEIRLPDSINDAEEYITEAVLECGCGKNYKIIPQEFTFYKQAKIPIPRRCPACRHKARFGLRNPLKLWKRKCDKCGNETYTSYPPSRPDIIYCEKCYLGTVY